ncbi:MAG: TOBE domain-containing protein [Tepidisphaeraceae bacterium]
MALSARNQFPGKVIFVKQGGVMAEVTLDIGGSTRLTPLDREVLSTYRDLQIQSEHLLDRSIAGFSVLLRSGEKVQPRRTR